MNILKKTFLGASLIRSGFIVDGSGKKGFYGDVLFDRHKILAVAKEKQIPQTGKDVIDCRRKKIVCPGFIDMHSHSDTVPFKIPHLDSKICQGITCEVIGNCGLTPFPCGKWNHLHLADVYHMKGSNRWTTFRSYGKDLEKTRPGLHLVPLVGQGTLHSFYRGYERKPAAASYLQKFRRKCRECFNQGAWGISLGLIYPPGCFIESRELMEVFRGAKESGCVVTAHMRDEGDRVEEALIELLEKARQTRARLHISHMKVSGKRNWKKVTSILGEIRAARRDGLQITADRYPYTASWTDLDTVLPDFIYEKGHKKEIEWLKVKEKREKVREVFFENPAHRDNDFFRSVLISQARGEKAKVFEGKTLEDLSRMTQKDPFDALCDLLVETRLMVTAVFFGMCERNMEKIILEPYTVIGTDSSAKSFDKSAGKPHPRAYGTFPKFIEHFIKSGKINLEKGIRKCTGLSSDILGLKNTGYLKPGYQADIVVFDMDRIRDMSTYTNPVVRPLGIDYVFVGGILAQSHGQTAKERNGHVILR
ncbi:MAG: amidohydrolase family protein [Candidatus Aureabacteria bacterium]|nr:amidohydrolase family protein [Candidatus Auribacterota bacterium]